jgi:mannosyltransferase
MHPYQNAVITWIARPNWFAFVDFYRYFVFVPSRPVLLSIGAGYLFLTAYSIFRTRNHTDPQRSSDLVRTIALLAWLAIPFAMLYLFSIVVRPVLNYRYLIISIPAAYLLLARSVTAAPLPTRVQNVVAGALVTYLLYYLIIHAGYYWTPTKEQYREAVGSIARQSQGLEHTLVVGCVPHPVFLD